MTRLESGVIRPALEWCDVRELLESAISEEDEGLRDRPVSLVVRDDLPLVLVDDSLIQQAVAKLLANACAYTPAHLPVSLAADCVRGRLNISVTDAGPGLPLHPERVFEKFYRGDAGRTGGLGLGLSIARGFVEAHGGTLTAENLAAGGARFMITLPVKTTDRSALESAIS